MKTVNELTRFDFHDSLIESIEYYEESNKVTIEIDFCNWKQEDYRDEDEETTMMYLSFEDVTDFIMPKVSLNSDEILEFNILEGGIEITAFNDIENISYTFKINSKYAELNKEV